MRRVLSAIVALVCQLVLGCVLALGAGLGDAVRACARHRTTSAAAFAFPAVGAVLWIGGRPIASIVVAAAGGLAACCLTARRANGVDRHPVSSGDPPWWPEFEEAFRRECELWEQSRRSRHEHRDR